MVCDDQRAAERGNVPHPSEGHQETQARRPALERRTERTAARKTMSTENTTTVEQPAPAAVRSSDGLGVRSRMVRCFHAETVRCPKCGLLPVDVTITSHTLNTWHRFECPSGNCSHKPPRYRPSHEEAAALWNDRALPHQPPTSRLETDGRATAEAAAAGEARTPNAPDQLSGDSNQKPK